MAPPRTIYHSPANVFVAAFIGEANLIPGELIETGAGNGSIRTGLGVFEGRLANPEMRAGDAACCLVRPECLLLSEAGKNRIGATVEDIVFLGESEQVLLKNGDTLLKALTIGAPAGIGKRTQASVSFRQEDALLLPSEGGKNA